MKLLVRTHLEKDGLIGTAENCSFPTLMKYACDNILKLKKSDRERDMEMEK